ncbi:MAG: sulfurtransferase complex subunit TusC [Rhodospirillales bacterium]|jgi:tRNA 2-thiouridine synthesizing protein C|nr:sulfurtransferase complex subunit TusC [Rhodospirillales bacterium]
MAETDFIDDGDEVNENAKKFMFVNRRAPYGTLYALESLELVLITGAFEQDVSVAFIDDGVFDIVKGHDTKAINMKNFSPTYRALEGYDIEKMYVEKESIEARGLTVDDFVVRVEVLSAEELSALMADQDVVISA